MCRVLQSVRPLVTKRFGPFRAALYQSDGQYKSYFAYVFSLSFCLGSRSCTSGTRQPPVSTETWSSIELRFIDCCSLASPPPTSGGLG